MSTCLHCNTPAATHSITLTSTHSVAWFCDDCAYSQRRRLEHYAIAYRNCCSDDGLAVETFYVGGRLVRVYDLHMCGWPEAKRARLMVTAFGAWDSDDLVAALRTCYPGTAVDISRCADSVWRADMHLFACRVAVALRDFPGVERVCQLVRPGDTFPPDCSLESAVRVELATDAGQVNVLVRLHDRCIPARAFGPEDELLLAWQTPPDQVVERWSALVTGTEAAP